MSSIRYTAGFKYQLHEDYNIDLAFHPPADIRTEYICFYANGRLWIREGYAWDGPSGPTVDTANFMRGSLVHDALYQLMRENHLDHDLYREVADSTLRTLCLEDGMCTARAWWVYQGVRWGGHPSADPRYQRPVLTAP
jgi:hypothetical protein